MKFATTTPKPFDLSYTRIDDRLQGSRLASFFDRFIAYTIDWIIISACTYGIVLVLPIGLIILFYKGWLKKALVKTRRLLRMNLNHLERKLDTMPEVEPILKRRLRKGIKYYLYFILYFPAFIIVLYAARVAFELASPEQYQATITFISLFFKILFKPVFALGNSLALIAQFLGAFLYFSIFTWKWNGQTPGKRLMKIRIVKLDGTRITFWNSLERASGYTASASIVFLGFIQYFWDKNAQTTHDKITETIVIEANSIPHLQEQPKERKEPVPQSQEPLVHES